MGSCISASRRTSNSKRSAIQAAAPVASAPTLERLPAEMQLEIVNKLSPPDLAHLARTSKHFAELAQPFLLLEKVKKEINDKSPADEAKFSEVLSNIAQVPKWMGADQATQLCTLIDTGIDGFEDRHLSSKKAMAVVPYTQELPTHEKLTVLALALYRAKGNNHHEVLQNDMAHGKPLFDVFFAELQKALPIGESGEKIPEDLMDGTVDFVGGLASIMELMSPTEREQCSQQLFDHFLPTLGQHEGYAPLYRNLMKGLAFPGRAHIGQMFGLAEAAMKNDPQHGSLIANEMLDAYSHQEVAVWYAGHANAQQLKAAISQAEQAA